MNILNKCVAKTTLGSQMVPGETFEFEGKIYMVVADSPTNKFKASANAVCLEDGARIKHGSLLVTRVNLEASVVA